MFLAHGRGHEVQDKIHRGMLEDSAGGRCLCDRRRCLGSRGIGRAFGAGGALLGVIVDDGNLVVGEGLQDR